LEAAGIGGGATEGPLIGAVQTETNFKYHNFFCFFQNKIKTFVIGWWFWRSSITHRSNIHIIYEKTITKYKHKLKLKKALEKEQK